MVSERMLGLGTARSVIRELFEYGTQRAAQVGAENVFDFSIGNPSVPAPDQVNETAIRILQEQPEITDGQADADPAVRLPVPRRGFLYHGGRGGVLVLRVPWADLSGG